MPPTAEQIMVLQKVVRDSAFDCTIQYLTQNGSLIFGLRGKGLFVVTPDLRIGADGLSVRF